jgi:hypothetical protein
MYPQQCCIPEPVLLIAYSCLSDRLSVPCGLPVCLHTCCSGEQRLLEENIEQQRMLEQLVVRLDVVERALQAMQEQRNKKSMFGGFLGPRAL